METAVKNFAVLQLLFCLYAQHFVSQRRNQLHVYSG